MRRRAISSDGSKTSFRDRRVSRARLGSTRTWWQVPLEVPARLEEMVVAALWEEGCLGVETGGLRCPRGQPHDTWSADGPSPRLRSRLRLEVFFPGTLRTG